jgi:hypothetical protein
MEVFKMQVKDIISKCLGYVTNKRNCDEFWKCFWKNYLPLFSFLMSKPASNFVYYAGEIGRAHSTREYTNSSCGTQWLA